MNFSGGALRLSPDFEWYLWSSYQLFHCGFWSWITFLLPRINSFVIFLTVIAENKDKYVSIFKIGVELQAPQQMGFQLRVFIFIDWFKTKYRKATLFDKLTLVARRKGGFVPLQAYFCKEANATVSAGIWTRLTNSTCQADNRFSSRRLNANGIILPPDHFFLNITDNQ